MVHVKNLLKGIGWGDAPAGKRLVALICVVAVSLSVGVGQNLKAAQLSPDVSVATVPNSAEIGDAIPGAVPDVTGFLFETSTLVSVAMITATLLVGYNVFTSGKNGWGWFTLVVIAGTIMLFLKLGISMFREMAATSAGSVTDWDSD